MTVEDGEKFSKNGNANGDFVCWRRMKFLEKGSMDTAYIKQNGFAVFVLSEYSISLKELTNLLSKYNKRYSIV